MVVAWQELDTVDSLAMEVLNILCRNPSLITSHFWANSDICSHFPVWALSLQGFRCLSSLDCLRKAKVLPPKDFAQALAKIRLPARESLYLWASRGCCGETIIWWKGLKPNSGFLLYQGPWSRVLCRPLKQSEYVDASFLNKFWTKQNFQKPDCIKMIEITCNDRLGKKVYHIMIIIFQISRI